MLHVGGDRDEFDGRYSLNCSLFLFLFFLSLCHLVVTFEPVDGFLKCDHSIESYQAVLFSDAAY